jgi:hypothetical protein
VHTEVEVADEPDPTLVVLVVVVLVAVVEVLHPRVVARVLRSVVLSTPPRRRLVPTNWEAAPNRSSAGLAVFVMRVSVAL